MTFLLDPIDQTRFVETPTEKHSLFYYAKTYRNYLLPTWLFPIYFLFWGFACQRFLPVWNPEVHLPLFFLTVGIPFFGAYFRSHQIRKEIPFWPYSFLTALVPFLLFVVIAIGLMVGQVLMMGYGHHL